MLDDRDSFFLFLDRGRSGVKNSGFERGGSLFLWRRQNDAKKKLEFARNYFSVRPGGNRVRVSRLEAFRSASPKY